MTEKLKPCPNDCPGTLRYTCTICTRVIEENTRAEPDLKEAVQAKLLEMLGDDYEEEHFADYEERKEKERQEAIRRTNEIGAELNANLERGQQALELLQEWEYPTPIEWQKKRRALLEKPDDDPSHTHPNPED